MAENDVPSLSEISKNIASISINGKLVVLCALLLILPTMKGCGVQVGYPLPITQFDGDYYEAIQPQLFVVNLIILLVLGVLISRSFAQFTNLERVQSGLSFAIAMMCLLGIAGIAGLLFPYYLFYLSLIFSLPFLYVGEVIGFILELLTISLEEKSILTIAHAITVPLYLLVAFAMGYGLGPLRKWYSNPFIWLVALTVLIGVVGVVLDLP